MDLKDYINMPLQSLQSMCSIRVVAHILDTRKNCRRKSKKSTEEVINALEVPNIIKAMLSDLVQPMDIQFKNWHLPLNFEYSPIWTPYGTVDAIKSIQKLIEDETLPRRRRLLAAMLYCQEEYIFKLKTSLNCWSKITFKHNGSKILHVWMDIMEAHRLQEVPDKHLLQDLYSRGIRYSNFHQFRWHHEVSFRYFVEKASSETLTNLLENSALQEVLETSLFSPSTYVLLFTKLKAFEQERWKSLFSLSLLISLLYWPYQFFFEGAALTLVGNLNSNDLKFLIYYTIQEAIYHNDHKLEHSVAAIVRAGAAEGDVEKRCDFIHVLRWLIRHYTLVCLVSCWGPLDKDPFGVAEDYFQKVIQAGKKHQLIKTYSMRQIAVANAVR